MKSIMQDTEKDACYLCMMLQSDYTRKITEEHHAIFGTGRRKLSEKYGLKVNLCIEHHRTGRAAVHQSAETALIVKKAAQRAFEERWPELSFLEIFGKNYLDEEETKPKEDSFGFMPISDGLEGLEW